MNTSLRQVGGKVHINSVKSNSSIRETTDKSSKMNFIDALSGLLFFYNLLLTDIGSYPWVITKLNSCRNVESSSSSPALDLYIVLTNNNHIFTSLSLPPHVFRTRGMEWSQTQITTPADLPPWQPSLSGH